MLAIVVGALEAAVPVLISVIFDAVLTGSGTASLSNPFGDEPFTLSVPPAFGGWIILLLVAVIVFKALAGYGTLTSMAYLGQSVVRDLRSDLYQSIMHQPLRFFSRHPTGELISRVSSDVEKVQTAASDTLAELLKQSAILVALVVVILWLDWRLSLMSLLLLPLMSYPAVLFGRRIRRLSRVNQEEMAGMANILLETVSGNRIVKIFTMEGAELGKFRRTVQKVFKLGFRKQLTQGLTSPLMEILGIFIIAGFLFYARNEIQAGRMTVGVFVSFMVALIKLYDPVRKMSGINNSIQQAIGSSGKLFEIMGSRTESDPGQRELTEFRHSIEFRDVHFAYDSGETTLDGVSFRLERGEVLAVVGSSGVGKTTLVNLVPRFYDVTAGSITIDGIDLREFRLQSLRRRITMVTQDVILFNDSVRTNIAYGNPDAHEEAILAASRAALVDDFVQGLPDGYDTAIGERGVRLSGGERQRISIARALLKDAPILILDEATSSLDTESEALVQQALHNLMEGRTTIVIAHRLSTVRRADRILVLSEGRVQEQGLHNELLSQRGIYWKLHKLQFEDVPS